MSKEMIEITSLLRMRFVTNDTCHKAADRIEELELVIATDTGTEGAVANLQGRVEELERELNQPVALSEWQQLVQERDALLADNARLLEAINRQPYTMDREVCEALAATPAQSLARYHNEVLEKAALIAEDVRTTEGYEYEISHAIRAAKEPECSSHDPN